MCKIYPAAGIPEQRAGELPPFRTMELGWKQLCAGDSCMTDRDLTFITGNPMKARQLGLHLDIPVAHLKLDLAEIQSLDLREVIEHKAREAYRHIEAPVLVEDTSLTFHELGMLPGPLIKWFLQELGNDGLCTLLRAHDDRAAVARVVFGLYDGSDAVRMFEGEAKGSIADQPRGREGFGWDPIFIPDGWTRTWGEMSPEEQLQSSMRRQALQKLQAYLGIGSCAR